MSLLPIGFDNASAPALYVLGRALYEKGGFSFEGLNDEGQLEVEEDYQICVRRC